MATGRENFALDWVKIELVQTLDEARSALEEYAETGDGDSQLQTCVESLHTLHGTLNLLGLSGVTLLAGHLEQLSRHLLEHAGEDQEKTCQTLMQGMLELPGHLDEMQRGVPDSVQSVIPLVNEIRSQLGDSPLSHDGQTDDGAAVEAAIERFRRIDGVDKAAKIRAAYQQVLLSILKGADRARAIQTLKKVAQGLRRICEGAPHETQWRVFEEFVTSLEAIDGPLDGDAVKLLRRVDAEIRDLAHRGESLLRGPLSTELVNRLFEACRRRGYRSDGLAALQDQFLRPAGSGVAIFGRQALAGAAAVLREELADLKDRLDMLSRADTAATDEVAELLGPLGQVASTLSLLGFDSSRRMVADQAATLSAALESGPVEASSLLAVANALIDVDENLVSFTEGQPEAEKITSAARDAAMAEARAALEEVKQQIVGFVAADRNAAELEGVPQRMATIAGALSMIPLPRAAALTNRCAEFIEQHLMVEGESTAQQVDLLAEGISGLDFYLERLANSRAVGSDGVLERVQQSLEKLAPGVADDRARVMDPDVGADEAAGVEEGVPADVQIVAAEAIGADLEEPRAETVDSQTPAEEADTDAPEEPQLERDDDAGFDLGNAIFDDLENDGRNAAGGSQAPQQAAEESVAAAPESADPAAGAGRSDALSPAVAARTSALADEYESDDEIVEIFMEEVDDVLAGVWEWLPRWREDLGAPEAMVELRRAFHTLKGSGRLVGANVIGELAWSVENMLNRLIDGTIHADASFVVVVEEAETLMLQLKQAFADRREPDMEAVGRVMERADVLASGGALAEAIDGLEVDTTTGTVDDGGGPGVGSDALELLVEEVEQHVASLRGCIRNGEFVINDVALRALHTISGGAGVSGIHTIYDLARGGYELASELAVPGGELHVSGDVADYFCQATSELAAALAALREGREPEDCPQVVAEAERLLVTAAGRRRSTPNDLMSMPALAVIMESADFLESWRDGSVDLEFAAKLGHALGEVSEAAAAESHTAIAELAGALRSAHAQLQHEALDEVGFRALHQGQERLLEQFDAIAADGTVAPALAEIAALNRLHEAVTVEEAMELKAHRAGKGDAVSIDAAGLESGGEAADEHFNLDELAPEIARQEQAPESDEQGLDGDEPIVPEEIDEEIVAIFFEEADEILEGLDQSIHDWNNEPENRLFLENLLRGLHTIKGGARLAGLAVLGDRTHHLESFLIDVQASSEPVGAEFFTDLSARHDELVALIGRIRRLVEQGTVADDEVSRPGPAAAEPAAPGATERRPHPEKPAPRPTASARPVAEAAEEPDPASQDGQRADRGKEMVRVGAGLLEDLVNLAGESSIVRARIEQGMSDFTGALEEMEMTIRRLREQLRRLEIETEAQILFRKDNPEGPIYDEFDPLEMDRYSQLQQISRGLSESASDMLDLKDTLLFKARESETLLMQQARINTELQEGLMRTRMVPFNRLLPRLRRIVRQVARELDKEVELFAYNVEGELDRNLLERMVPPLEHMLRNAVDHGIESADERERSGKSRTGRIELRLSREGGDVVIDISDDGAGIDVESVRVKAVESGLMSEDTLLRDDEISQFVLAPGFTTAKSVTQISGRGVGMDVVHSAVKQLGGSINIVSNRGKGSRFVVRVPFTVSVNRALMVSVGDDLYAIPLNTIEGIVLLGPEELEQLYAPDGSAFEYAGVSYSVKYLGHYLGREFRVSSLQSSVPVVLVRSGDQAVAVHVDAVQGSREIVVKSLGPQFAGVGGVSGATILGDGSVVVILDLLALIRAQSTGLARGGKSTPRGGRARCVMVVDDSVTVRKVTSRLLERQGMDVMVAKDGVEAISMLQERRPDVMLLDIEMPRMDGFEVAGQVRRDDRLQELPIIMISSRTGQKHQERAAELKVNSFLGKPFQENELLATIDELVD